MKYRTVQLYVQCRQSRMWVYGEKIGPGTMSSVLGAVGAVRSGPKLGPKALLVLLVASMVSARTSSSSMLFILHDAGETYMAIPPMQQLLSEGFSLSVLALGEPAKTMFAPGGGGSGIPAVTLADIGVNVTVADGTRAARAQLLPPDDIEAVQRYYLLGESAPGLVVSGTVYAMQSQLALAMAPAYVVGLDDSFALWSNSSLPARLFVTPRPHAAAETPVADELFVTAER